MHHFYIGLSLLLLLLLTSCTSQEPEKHLIAKGFTGKVVILFNQPDGAPKEYEGSTRIYRIPSSGILKSQFAILDGLMSDTYYYLDEADKEIEIKNYDSAKALQLHKENKLDPKLIAKFGGEIGQASGHGLCQFEYITYDIGTYEQIYQNYVDFFQVLLNKDIKPHCQESEEALPDPK